MASFTFTQISNAFTQQRTEFREQLYSRLVGLVMARLDALVKEQVIFKADLNDQTHMKLMTEAEIIAALEFNALERFMERFLQDHNTEDHDLQFVWASNRTFPNPNEPDEHLALYVTWRAEPFA